MGEQILSTLYQIEQLLKAQNLLQKEVLTFEEACLYLNLSESHLYKLTSAREIPHYKPQGKKLYFKSTELNSWMLSVRISTYEEVESSASTYMVVNK
ncbi:helix-turn-helix domain-containing protein [Pontibacter korlensis]|uniref:Helix-turn-helix domain-containing protein n=1 Tax=Pontibacter korlensis TaxID=400092 RepID=A0A0E3ZFM9_9BACT|nr:helix-turn-helix domain-containing protein [Pontibacter korlensis]AKD04379.1 hypothetical protein PKOR_16405 [Pontibacter korlensis]